MQLPGALALGIELALNRYLAADPEVAARLRRIDGQRIAMELDDLQIRLLLRINGDLVQLMREPGRVPADTTISGKLMAFAAMGRGAGAGAGLFGGDIQIRGNIDSGQCFQEVLAAIEIDWPALLQSRLQSVTAGVVDQGQQAAITDALLQFASDGMGQVRRWASSTGKIMQTDVVEYLQEEVSLTPGAAEFEGLSADIAALRNDEARLEARLRRLQQHMDEIAEGVSEETVAGVRG